jgi:hypothetical protein
LDVEVVRLPARELRVKRYSQKSPQMLEQVAKQGGSEEKNSDIVKVIN